MIDNDVDTLTKARRILEFEGYSTLCVSTEAEAISALDSYKPSLIISETIFSGYSGFKLIKLLKAKGQDVPVLFLSKNSNPVNHVLAINSGGADFLTKPYDVTVFLAHIKKVITNYEKQKDV